MSAAPASHARRALAAAALALLAGCAVQPVPPSAAPAERPVAATFSLEGRLSATDGARAASGRLEWHHSPATDEWTVFNPLGQIAARLISTPRGARLQTADGRTVEARDVGTLLPQLVGVQVPLDGLAHWVQAGAREGARVLGRDAAGRPTRISDDGWLIDYAEYAAPEPAAPPRRIDARWGEAHLRLVIDQWTAQP